MVCFHSEYLHTELYEEQGVLVSQWYGKCTSQQYRDAHARFAYIVKQKNIQFAISDRRLLPPISQEDIDWTVNVFAKQFCQLPLKRFAYINCFNEAAGAQLQTFLSNPFCKIPFEVKVFEDLTSAYDWLVSVKA
ncbi:hypothetical protein CLV24_12837 [Pontibacter ummariensis]|uniref:SpoIIAA-like n=1 Tax=Pontibacter ummariensis TaxID=1610492 RepID=A0A239KAF4_9BACT|nr:hypothetical protein [Pontibacter ummariensis]PRY06055.1 hypothetical protein CLV24_12837 [Pontibacter ummariensis]SNT14619.1 hypothetical protein SAMN06296052_12737 [Pontibacter ummariensis]